MKQPTRFQVLTLLIFCELAAIPHASNVNETIRASLPLGNCAYELETEYYGKHFRKLTVENPGECCDACQKDPKCNVWTYKLPSASKNRKTCWLLKDATVVNRVESNPDILMVSGIRENKKIPHSSITIEDGARYGEKDLYRLATSNAQSCAQFCIEKLLCKAISFDEKRRMCYAKRGTWKKERAVDWFSAVVW